MIKNDFFIKIFNLDFKRISCEAINHILISCEAIASIGQKLTVDSGSQEDSIWMVVDAREEGLNRGPVSLVRRLRWRVTLGTTLV